MRIENYFVLMLVLLVIGVAFFFSPVWEETRIVTTATGTPIGRVKNMLSVPEQFTPGEEFTIRVVTWNDGEKGILFCRLINRDTEEEIEYRTLYFPANKGATFIFTIVTDQTTAFKVKAEVGHDNVVDDTGNLIVLPATQGYTWNLKEGWNDIIFEQKHLDAVGSSHPEDVFKSIDHDCILNYVFEEGTWKNYWFCDENNPGSRGGTLQEIKPGVIYKVKVSQDCILDLKPMPPSLSVSLTVTQTVGIISLLGALVLGVKYFSIL